MGPIHTHRSVIFDQSSQNHRQCSHCSLPQNKCRLRINRIGQAYKQNRRLLLQAERSVCKSLDSARRLEQLTLFYYVYEMPLEALKNLSNLVVQQSTLSTCSSTVNHATVISMVTCYCAKFRILPDLMSDKWNVSLRNISSVINLST